MLLIFNLMFVGGLLAMLSLAFGWGWVAAGVALFFVSAAVSGLRGKPHA